MHYPQYTKYHMSQFDGDYGWFACFVARCLFRDKAEFVLTPKDQLHRCFVASLSPVLVADSLIDKKKRRSK